MESRIVPLYFPQGVDKFLASGSSSFIGRLNEKMVLKYPRVVGEDWDRLVLEARIYKALGRHPRIIACFGIDERGLKLEYAPKGTVRNLLRNSHPDGEIPLHTRLKYARQAAEAVAYMHTKNVIHCDISTRNFLLDDNLDLKLSDFQGVYTDFDGRVYNGYALENAKSYLPRPPNHSDVKSDIFALGTAIYEIMVGHEPFPELDEDIEEEEIERRYREGHFPSVQGVLGGHIIQKCWSLTYDSTIACVDDLLNLERLSGGGE